MHQARKMLAHTEESVVLFYTKHGIYVVDAARYAHHDLKSVRTPLMKKYRVISLGTYLGDWIPRCCKGDEDGNLISRVTHLDGFRHGLSMEMISRRQSIA
jgi:hypothetical protein